MKLKVVDADGEQVFFSIAHREDTAMLALWNYIKTDFGPLSNKPESLTELADAIADAYGGELSLISEE